jgi:hypothetical protein
MGRGERRPSGLDRSAAHVGLACARRIGGLWSITRGPELGAHLSVTRLTRTRCIEGVKLGFGWTRLRFGASGGLVHNGPTRSLTTHHGPGGWRESDGGDTTPTW